MQSLAIALCTHNGARYLDEQLRTLRAQAGVEEIVVVDDASADSTWTILEEHARQDVRLRLYRNTRALGVTRNFERAISLVQSDWIALADQDDVWLSNKLARLRAAWDEEACLLHHATHKFRGAPPPALPSPAGERRKFFGDDPRRLFYRNTIVGHTVVMRTRVARSLMPFPRAVPHDWWLGVGAALRGRVQYVDEYLVHYRIHENNAYHAAGSRWRRLRAEHGLRLELLRALEGRTELSDHEAEFAANYRRLLSEAATGVFPWALGRFYFRHAGELFGDGQFPSFFCRLRKSGMAAFGAMVAGSPASPELAEVSRPPAPAPVESRGTEPLRRTG